ncbi:MAG: sigma-70 family RNA polymerase sigma factor [Saprospiraceae bacterium]|nr:sigma-70 family RNA polymerase sigma factor [Saprospiraceae bacterium]
MNQETNIHSEDQKLFQALKDGNMEAFDQLYSLYRYDFIKTAKYRFNSNREDDIVDAWQDAVISFYDQIKSGKLQSLSCTIKSFLYLIGFRILIKTYNYNSKHEPFDSFASENENLKYAYDMELLPELDEKQTLLNKKIVELPEQSRRMIMLRYVDGKSIAEIKNEMNYQSENAISVNLSRTLKKLKELIEQARNI